MKKWLISVLSVVTLATSFGGFASAIHPTTANAQTMVWVDYSPRAHKYHYTNPQRRYAGGSVNHHWHKVTLSWAKQNGYTQSLN